MQRYLFFLVFIVVLSNACKNTSNTTNKDTAKAIVVDKKVSAKSIPGLPPIYEKFEDLAAIFQQQNDTTYVINFWATWCAPCVKELPYFETLTKKYQNEKVKVILVSLDCSKQLETKLKPFLEKNKLTSEVLVLIDPDANSWVDKVNPAWSGAIPATVVYKRTKSKFYEQSFEDLSELEAIVQPFL